jgi:hypothetical protein
VAKQALLNSVHNLWPKLGHVAPLRTKAHEVCEFFHTNTLEMHVCRYTPSQTDVKVPLKTQWMMLMAPASSTWPLKGPWAQAHEGTKQQMRQHCWSAQMSIS